MGKRRKTDQELMEEEAAEIEAAQEEHERLRLEALELYYELPEHLQTDDMLPFCIAVVKKIEER